MHDPYYELEKTLQEYLLFHYGDPDVLMPWDFGPVNGLNFPVRCVSEGLRADELPETARGLDLGCAVGRSTFELAKHCDEVIGIDASHSFILAARTICREKSLPYFFPKSGGIMHSALAQVPDIDCQRVQFEQGDVQNLRPNLGSFDVVLAANLLCRLPRPRKLLDRLPELVRSGGQLIITTPMTWLESFTEREFWIGGTPEAGDTLTVLKQILEPNFHFANAKDLPFQIREHERKFQWTVTQMSIWNRR